MFKYYVYLGLRSLRRNVALTALAIIVIGVGTGASMSMLTIMHAASGDPIPQKSTQLFVPQIDNFGPQPGSLPHGEDQLPTALTYTDAIALKRAGGAFPQAAMYPTTLTISVPGTSALPLQGQALATDSSFFPMFDVRFRYGGGWNRSDDDAHAPMIVLSRAFNDRLFGGSNSVGRNLMVNARQYRIVGVIGSWQPSPHFYVLGANSYGSADQLFVPFTRAIDDQIKTSGSLNCDRRGPGSGWSSLLNSNCVWIHLWTELPTTSRMTQYRAFLQNYASDQRRQGRFNWVPRVALRNVTQWLAYNQVVPNSLRTLTNISFAILAVCVFNASGLMLAKFMADTAAIGVRRALGATRSEMLTQCLVEAWVIGSAGGVVGIALTQLGLIGCRGALDQDLSGLTQLHTSEVAVALAVAIGATLVAGLYPTLRAAHVQPAALLKL